MTTLTRATTSLLSSFFLLGMVAACDELLGEGLPLPTDGSEGDTPPAPSEPTAPDAPDATTHWIFRDELKNARDLGGVPLADGRTSAYGVVFRGPPLALTEGGCSEFAELGIRTVVDLRSAGERESAPEADCVLNSASIVLAPLDTNWTYRDYVTGEAGLDAILKTFGVLADPEAHPVYIHCTLGRDRSGVMSALILGALGASRAEIVAEYDLSRTSVGAYPSTLTAALDIVDSFGDTEAFLLEAGVTAEQLHVLRERLIAEAE